MSPRRQAGFSLVEMVVAVAILSLGLLAAYEAFATGLRGAERTRSEAEAVAVAESLLAELGVTRPVELGVVDGTDPVGLDWRLSVALYDEDRFDGDSSRTLALGDRQALVRATVDIWRAGRPVLRLTSLRRVEIEQ